MRQKTLKHSCNFECIRMKGEASYAPHPPPVAFLLTVLRLSICAVLLRVCMLVIATVPLCLVIVCSSSLPQQAHNVETTSI